MVRKAVRRETFPILLFDLADLAQVYSLPRQRFLSWRSAIHQPVRQQERINISARLRW